MSRLNPGEIRLGYFGGRTRDNDAMVEEATAISHSLAREAERLAGLMGRFRFTPMEAASSARAA